MCATFTGDDVGKPVERTDGKVIGTVASLEDGQARVEPAPDVVDQLKVRFGGAEPGGPFILDESDVRQISETRVHLAEGFSRSNQAATASAAAGRSGAEGAGETGQATESTDSARSGETTATTQSTAETGGIGPFHTKFQLGAAVVSALFVLLALAFGGLGYQGSELVGTELNLISGMAGLMLFAFFSVVALVAAIYMEPGFDH